MDTTQLITLAATLVLAASIAYTGKLGFLNRHPRSHWLSAASGVTIGYVFLGLLPKLENGSDKLAGKAEGVLPFLEDHVYFVALLGVLVFYALKVATHVSRREGARSTASATMFALTIGLFSVYVFLLGELLHATGEKDLASMLVLAAALTFHFAGSDFGLREDHSDQYVAKGRWVLAAAALAGWAAGELSSPPFEAITLATAFLAGAIIVNVLNDEVPEPEHAHYLPFAVGAIVSGVLLASIG